MPTFYKILATVVITAGACLAAMTIALRIWLPPDKVRRLVTTEAGRFLHREVRFKSVSLGVFKGLVLQGLEVSEKPDFTAGVFAGVDAFRFRVQWLPLLHKKVVIDEITITGPSLAVTQIRPGVFNFSDLLAAGPSQTVAAKPVAPAPGLSLPFALQAGQIMLENGRISYRDMVSGAQWRITGLRAAIKDMNLLAPFGVEGSLKAEQVSPGRLLAKTDFSAEMDLSGLSSGKLSAVIRRCSADLSGLVVSLEGPVRVAPDRIETGQLKGRLGGAALAFKATILDYAQAPDARLEARLGELDAAKLLELKDLVAGQGQQPLPRAASATPAPAIAAAREKPASQGPPMKTSGKIEVEKILYHKLRAKNAVLTWDLRGITPDLRGLSGRATMEVGGGSFEAEENADRRSPFMTALLIPLTVLKQIGRLGGALHVLPPFDKLVFSEIKGDYAFARGLMTIRDFRMKSPLADVTAGGVVDLPAQKLNLQVAIALPGLAPIGVDVGGTFSDPKPRLRLNQAVTDSVRKLAQPAMKLLQGLFK